MFGSEAERGGAVGLRRYRRSAQTTARKTLVVEECGLHQVGKVGGAGRRYVAARARGSSKVV